MKFDLKFSFVILIKYNKCGGKVMKDELNLIESQILRIFRNNKKNADDSMDTKKVLTDSLKALEDNFDVILNSLTEKGFILQSGDKLILTDKGDEYLYRTKLYSDY
jgi:hypothetical protein